MNVSIVVPTYNRGDIVVETLRKFLALEPPAVEIIVVDQTLDLSTELASRMTAWHEQGAIRWIRLPSPSIPHAMNVGLATAKSEIVLFLDDDVVPVRDIVARHAAAYDDPETWAVVGQCLQPGEVPAHHPDPHRIRDGVPDLEFPFNYDAGTFIRGAIAMNFSVRRARALEIGVFDENFSHAAYRFESDFALRLSAAGGKIWFEPKASVDHLKLAVGGVRAHGNHMRSMSPRHSTGDYYFALKHVPTFWIYSIRRLKRNVLTRYHLRHPWFIPPKIVGELRGMLDAFRLRRLGPRLWTRECSEGTATSSEVTPR